MGIKMAKTPLITIFHSDMVCSKNYLENMLKHWSPKTVVCATRIEPEGIYPPGKEKILKPFGIEYFEFKHEDFHKFVEQEQITSKDKTSAGMFAPWLMSKEDFLAIGGHDAKSFAPYPEEDADLFLRWALVGYKLIQSRDSLCWHWISRGHRSWAKNGVGKDDNMFAFYQNRARRNYLRKWNKWMAFDENHHPIPHPVYDVGFVVNAKTASFIHALEPWCKRIYINDVELIKQYLATEQPTTKIDLSDRVMTDTAEHQAYHNLLLFFSEENFMKSPQENMNIIQNLSAILKDGYEPNTVMELGCFKMKTFGGLKDISKDLIKV
jgi:hypothetical protein